MSKMQHTFKWSNGRLNKNELAKLKAFLEKLNREFEALKLELPNFAKKNETNIFTEPQKIFTTNQTGNHQILIGNNRLVMSYRISDTAPWTNSQFIGFYGNNVRFQSTYTPTDNADLTNKDFVEGLVRPFQQQIQQLEQANQQLINQMQQMQQQVTQALQLVQTAQTAAQAAEQKATNAENLVNQLQAELVNYARLDRDNEFTGLNRFNGNIEANSRFVSNGIATFNDIVSMYQRLNLFKNIQFLFNQATMGWIEPLNANELKIYTIKNGSKVWINNGQFTKT